MDSEWVSFSSSTAHYISYSMLNFLYNAVHHCTSCCTIRAPQKFHTVETHLAFLWFKSVRYISSTSNQHSFKVSYLINSCGFSLETALTVSENVNFETPNRADLVISIFKKYGFSQTQISNIIRAFPTVLLSNPHKTLLPKLEFFQSKAFTSSDIATVLSRNPQILRRSLKNYIIPSFSFLKNFFGTNEDVINAIIRFWVIPVGRFNNCVLPNVNLLREIGVPESHISSLLKQKHSAAVTNPVRFKEIVEKVKEMGFNPLKISFIQAVFAMVGMNKSTWERKVNVYKRWDLSQEEILAAFRKCPSCIIASEDKIMQVMDFYVNKMGFETSFIVNRPILIIYSLEKRLIPRASVIEVLQSKGLIKKNIHLARVFSSSENSFLQKFVTPYMDKVSDLLKLYKGKLDFSKMTTK